MSAQDTRAEREVADFYDEAIRPTEKKGKPTDWRRFGANFLTGYALGRTIRRLF